MNMVLGFGNFALESSPCKFPCWLYSLSKLELYSEPVVFSDFLSIIYCLYNLKVNSLMPVNLKKERACTLHTLYNKKKFWPVSIYLHKNLKLRLSIESIASTCTP